MEPPSYQAKPDVTWPNVALDRLSVVTCGS